MQYQLLHSLLFLFLTKKAKYPGHVISEQMEKVVTAKKKGFLLYIHSFRGIAIVLIVASHILAQDTESSIFYNVLSALFLNSTLFFVFISGFLFQHLSYKYEVRTYWKKKFQTIILPYLVISVPAILLRLHNNYVPFTVSDDLHFQNWNVLLKIGYFYVTGAHLLPFWYIPMIVLFYCISPLLVKLDRDGRFYWLLPVLLFVSLYFPRDNIFEINNIPRMFAHYFSIYVLGMFFSRYKEEIFPVVARYWTGIIMLAATLLFLSCFQFEYTVHVIFIQKVVLCVVMLYWLRKHEDKIPPVLGDLAVLSFGIYFVHYYIILATRTILMKTLGHELPQNLPEWVLVFTFVFFITYALVHILRYILGNKSRILIGC